MHILRKCSPLELYSNTFTLYFELVPPYKQNHHFPWDGYYNDNQNNDIICVYLSPLLPVSGLGSLTRQTECSLYDMLGPTKKLRYRSLEYLQKHDVYKEQYTTLNIELMHDLCFMDTIYSSMKIIMGNISNIFVYETKYYIVESSTCRILLVPTMFLV